MPADTANYGSIEEGDKSFDATKLQYLGKGKPLSKEEKIRKLIRVGVPLLLSGLIVWAAVYFLTTDFTHLYPGRGGHGGESTITVSDGGGIDSSATTKSPTTTTTTTVKHAKVSIPSSAVDSKCASHDACSGAGLIGNCCPTNDGFFLDCCN